jgi:hypothetical protein
MERQDSEDDDGISEDHTDKIESKGFIDNEKEDDDVASQEREQEEDDDVASQEGEQAAREEGHDDEEDDDDAVQEDDDDDDENGDENGDGMEEDEDDETVIEVYDDNVKGPDQLMSEQTFHKKVVSKHHPLLGVVASMIFGGVYLHCECGHVRRVEEQWAGKIELDGPGFVDQMKPCPHSLYRRTNSFKKMKLHIKKCTSKIEGERAREDELPPLFRRTYKNKVVPTRR